MILIYLFYCSQSVNTSNYPRNQPPSNWRNDHGYDVPKNGKPYPHRVYGTGLQFSLILILRLNISDIDYLCGGPIQGFKIVFHSPSENQSVMKKYFFLSPGKSSFYRIEPKMVLTTDAARTDYSPDERRCFLQTERKLRFYKYYTQRNCEVECLTNFTLTQCGCVPFYMARKKFCYSYSTKRSCMLTFKAKSRSKFTFQMQKIRTFAVLLKCSVTK